MWTWLVIFASMFALDFVWAFYMKAVQRSAAFSAASWAIAITVFNGAVQIGYIADHWLLVPAAAGAFIGTFFALKVVGK
jgi:hypothetical protein